MARVPFSQQFDRTGFGWRRAALVTVMAAWTVVAPGLAQEEQPGWPRTIETQGYVITVYQPQTDRYEGDTLEGRAAVSARRADGTGGHEDLRGAAGRAAQGGPGPQGRLRGYRAATACSAPTAAVTRMGAAVPSIHTRFSHDATSSTSV